MQAGRLLIRAGRLEHARVFLEQARALHRRVESGRTARACWAASRLRLGMPGRAAGRFEEILALAAWADQRFASNSRRSTISSGATTRRRYHFNSVPGRRVCRTSVEATLSRSFLRRYRRPKEAGRCPSRPPMLPDNQALRIVKKSIRIGGVPFRLDEDARASSGVGVLLSDRRFRTRRQITDDIPRRARLRPSAAEALSSVRTGTTSRRPPSDVGLTRLSDNGSVSAVRLRVGRRWTGGDALSTATSVPGRRVRWRLSRLDPPQTLALSAGHQNARRRGVIGTGGASPRTLASAARPRTAGRRLKRM